jgi:hypothetical protein
LGKFRAPLTARQSGDLVSPTLLELWLKDIAGRPIGGHVLRGRADSGRVSWRLERVEEPEPLQATLAEDPSPAEMLARNVEQSLRRQAELLNLPIDMEDPKTMRLIADVANQTLNAGLRAQESALAAKRDGNRMPSARLLEAVRRADELCAADRKRAVPDPPDDAA